MPLEPLQSILIKWMVQGLQKTSVTFGSFPHQTSLMNNGNLPPHQWFPTCGAMGHYSKASTNTHSADWLNSMFCTYITTFQMFAFVAVMRKMWTHLQHLLFHTSCWCIFSINGCTTLIILDSMTGIVVKKGVSHSKGFGTMPLHLILYKSAYKSHYLMYYIFKNK